MSNEENEQDFDAESLAALARSSIAGPPPTKSVPPAAGVKDDSGLLNLKALAEQAGADVADVPESAPVNGKSAPPAARTDEPASKASSRPAPAHVSAPPAAVAAAPAPVQPAARSNALLYALAAVAIAAIGAWVYVKQTSRPVEPTEPAAEAERSEGANEPGPSDTVALADPPRATAPEPVAEPPAPEATSPGAGGAEPATTASGETPPVAAATDTPASPGAAAGEPARTRDERERDRERERAERERVERREGNPTQASSAATPAPAPAATPAPAPAATPAPARAEQPAGERAATKRGSSVDELLDRALGGSPSQGGVGTDRRPERAERAEPAADLPDVPPRSAITSALGRLRRPVENCANGQVGVARAEVTFSSDGNVSGVTISGTFAGTPAGACMERVVRRAHVPRFRRPSLSITYPFSIRPPEP